MNWSLYGIPALEGGRLANGAIAPGPPHPPGLVLTAVLSGGVLAGLALCRLICQNEDLVAAQVLPVFGKAMRTLPFQGEPSGGMLGLFHGEGPAHFSQIDLNLSAPYHLSVSLVFWTLWTVIVGQWPSR